MKLIETMPNTFKEKIRGILPPEEVELICASTDLHRDGNFGTGWLVVTNKQIVLLSPGDTNGIVRVPVEEIVSARTEPLVGGQAGARCAEDGREQRGRAKGPPPRRLARQGIRQHPAPTQAEDLHGCVESLERATRPTGRRAARARWDWDSPAAESSSPRSTRGTATRSLSTHGMRGAGSAR